jgi:hypothetical protein
MGQFRPTLVIWSILNMMAMQNDALLYWRVAAYDENFNQILATPARTLLIGQ